MADIELLKRLAEACDIERCADEGEYKRNLIEFYEAADPEDVAALIAENERLRQIISDSATACGAAMSPECTAEFMGHLPAEIAVVFRQLRAELAQVKDKNASFSYHMRDFAFRLGAGGYNAPEVDPDVFASKIHGGIDMMERAGGR